VPFVDPIFHVNDIANWIVCRLRVLNRFPSVITATTKGHTPPFHPSAALFYVAINRLALR
jgi:hypothetical protein